MPKPWLTTKQALPFRAGSPHYVGSMEMGLQKSISAGSFNNPAIGGVTVKTPRVETPTPKDGKGSFTWCIGYITASVMPGLTLMSTDG